MKTYGGDRVARDMVARETQVRLLDVTLRQVPGHRSLCLTRSGDKDESALAMVDAGSHLGTHDSFFSVPPSQTVLHTLLRVVGSFCVDWNALQSGGDAECVIHSFSPSIRMQVLGPAKISTYNNQNGVRSCTFRISP